MCLCALFLSLFLPATFYSHTSKEPTSASSQCHVSTVQDWNFIVGKEDTHLKRNKKCITVKSSKNVVFSHHYFCVIHSGAASDHQELFKLGVKCY